MKTKKLTPQPNTSFVDGLRAGRKYGRLVAPFVLAAVTLFVIWMAYRIIHWLIVHTRP